MQVAATRIRINTGQPGFEPTRRPEPKRGQYRQPISMRPMSKVGSLLDPVSDFIAL